MTPATGTDERSVPLAVLVPPGGDAPSVTSRRKQEAAVELVLGTALVALTAIGGLWYAVRPASGRLDGWLLDLVTSSRSRWFIDVTRLHEPWVIVTGAVIAALVCLPRDRPRSLACLIGPPLALILCEEVVKPAVGRTLGGALSYPSGSTVGAAALATVAVLVTPARWRALAATAGAVYVVWMSMAVVALRWHYPTDALAGVAFGVGTVLLVDGLVWLALSRRTRRTGTARGPGPTHRSSGTGR